MPADLVVHSSETLSSLKARRVAPAPQPITKPEPEPPLLRAQQVLGWRQEVRRWLVLASSILFIVLAVSFALLGNKILAEQKASVSWPTTPGTISYCELREHRSRMRYTREVKIDYSVDVSYSYRIDGNATTGHRIGVSQEYTDKDTAFEKIKRYDVGSTHPVFYNPESPDESVLEPGVQEGKSRDFNTMMRIWLPLIFVFVSLLGIGFFFARI